MSEQTDDLVKYFSGDSDQKRRELLWTDLQRFLTFVLFKDYCERQDDIATTRDAVIKVWRERVLEGVEAEIRKNEEIRKTPMGALLGDMISQPDASREKIQDEINDIEQILRRAIKTEGDS